MRDFLKLRIDVLSGWQSVGQSAAVVVTLNHGRFFGGTYTRGGEYEIEKGLRRFGSGLSGDGPGVRPGFLFPGKLGGQSDAGRFGKISGAMGTEFGPANGCGNKKPPLADRGESPGRPRAL